MSEHGFYVGEVGRVYFFYPMMRQVSLLMARLAPRVTLPFVLG